MARRRRNEPNGHDTTGAEGKGTGTEAQQSKPPEMNTAANAATAKPETKAKPKSRVQQDKTRYRVVRFFRDHTPSRRLVRGMGGLTLEQAQKHCRDPETSSSTCRASMNLKRTAEYGPWFDGYEVDRG